MMPYFSKKRINMMWFYVIQLVDLQTKVNLMAELSKMRRVIEKVYPMHHKKHYLLLMLQPVKMVCVKRKSLKKQQMSLVSF
jgi:hypothetical protein